MEETAYGEVRLEWKGLEQNGHRLLHRIPYNQIAIFMKFFSVRYCFLALAYQNVISAKNFEFLPYNCLKPDQDSIWQ